MSLRKYVNIHALHHAYVVEGTDEVFDELRVIARDILGDALEMSPDGFEKTYETLGIDDARELVRLAHMKPVGERKMFVCKTVAITGEAQNALLKLFEEPPGSSHIFLCMRQVSDLLPTLRSRVWIVEHDTHKHETGRGQRFLQASPKERLEVVQSITKEKDAAGARALLNDIERTLYDRFHHQPDVSVVEALRHIGVTRGYMSDKGASLKTLLESVALVVPIAPR